MPSHKRPSTAHRHSRAPRRNAEGHLFLKDGSIDGRSLRATGRDRRFMVRVEATFPQEVKVIAARTGKTMGQVVQEAVREHFLSKRRPGDPQLS